MPTLDIGEHAFDVIFTAYKQLLAEQEGYIVQNGEIWDIPRLERLFGLIGEQEVGILQAREVEAKAFNSKKRKFKDAGPVATDEELEEAEAAAQRAYEEAVQIALHGAPLAAAVAEAKEEEDDEDDEDDDEDDGPEEGAFVDGAFVPAGKTRKGRSGGGGGGGGGGALSGPLEGAKDYRGRYYYEKFKVLPGVPIYTSSPYLIQSLSNPLSRCCPGCPRPRPSSASCARRTCRA